MSNVSASCLCETPVKRKKSSARAPRCDELDYYRSAYQRAHYYQDLQKIRDTRDRTDRKKYRPDLFYCDPIVNKKQSTCQRDYREKKFNEIYSESYKRFNCASKFTLKTLYDEFYCKPPRILNHDKTTSGTNFIDPSTTIDAYLLEKFASAPMAPPTEKSLPEDRTPLAVELMRPYDTTTHRDFRDHCEARAHGIARPDILTCYNRGRDEAAPPPEPREPFQDKRRLPFRVPFGDCSVYCQSYRDPAAKDAYLTDVCVPPEYFDSVAVKAKEVPGMYFTTQDHVGSAKPTWAIV